MAVILIFASSLYQNDPQIELLVNNLKAQSIEFVLINPFKYSDLSRIKVTCRCGVNTVFYDGVEICVTKVYVARHLRTDCILDVPGECTLTTLYRHKAETFLSELCGVLGGESWFPGKMQNLKEGDMKCYVYQVAHGCGLTVPEITENSFSKPRGLSYQKSLGAPFTLTYDSDSREEIAVTLMNSVVTEDDSGGLPWQWQSHIAPQFQVRCVVVGERVWSFSASEDQFQGMSLREYQSDNDVEWSAYVLPGDVKQGLLSLNKKLALDFACPEFLVDASGSHYFIDLNPCGDWFGFGTEDESEQIVKEIVKQLRV